MQQYVTSVNPDTLSPVQLSHTAPYNFISQHPELKAAMPKMMPATRIQNTCKEIIEPWLQLLEDIIRTYQVPPELIANIDETPLQSNGKQHLVIIPKTLNEKPVIEGDDRRKTLTLTLGICMDGRKLPSQLISKSMTVPPEYESLPADSIFPYATASGFQETKTFVHFISNHIVPFLVEKRKLFHLGNSSILLILDDHSSRDEPEYLELCAKNNIIVFTLPSHTSHVLQPLDCGINGPMKDDVNQQLSRLDDQFVFFFITSLQKALFRLTGLRSLKQHLLAALPQPLRQKKARTELN